MQRSNNVNVSTCYRNLLLLLLLQWEEQKATETVVAIFIVIQICFLPDIYVDLLSCLKLKNGRVPSSVAFIGRDMFKG